ncbi:DNA methyltransferase [Klebsiella quasipneumoniae]|uniref:DNA methyltransferase n=1 Tax=Klebsiella quasipneumoniae TaxID=1463165 RepID=UPI00388DBCE7
MCSHWFGASQWQLPNERQYLALRAPVRPQSRNIGIVRAACGATGGIRHFNALYSNWLWLQLSNCDSNANLRRPFHVTKDVPLANVWTYPTGSVLSGKHPIEKPLQMMRHHFACTRHGDVIADFFMGSGHDKSWLQLGRRHRRRAGSNSNFTDGRHSRQQPRLSAGLFITRHAGGGSHEQLPNMEILISGWSCSCWPPGWYQAPCFPKPLSPAPPHRRRSEA